jgi:hypothetical protein
MTKFRVNVRVDIDVEVEAEDAYAAEDSASSALYTALHNVGYVRELATSGDVEEVK